MYDFGRDAGRSAVFSAVLGLRLHLFSVQKAGWSVVQLVGFLYGGCVFTFHTYFIDVLGKIGNLIFGGNCYEEDDFINHS